MFLLALVFSAPVLASPDGKSSEASQAEQILIEELDRGRAFLSTQPIPPYYISLALQERQEVRVRAWADAIEKSEEIHRRHLDVDLRVGSPEIDNTHENYRHMPSLSAGVSLALEENEEDYPLRHATWRLLDRSYEDAVEALELIHSRMTTRVEPEVQAPDFELRSATIYRDETPPLQVDHQAWQDRLVAASQLLAADSLIIDSSVSLQANRIVDTFVDTEGSRIRHGRISIRLSLHAETVAEDGEQLEIYRSKEVHRLEGLAEVDLLEWAKQSIAELHALRDAPRVEPYSGPVILSGKAAGVFIHEVLGHRSEGHRQKLDSEGRTFADQVGELILPEFVDIVDDPLVDHLVGEDLNGAYLFDSEGVAAQPASIVEDGRLVGFLMSRSPIPAFVESNGHGRKEAGSHATGRMANTILSTNEGISKEALRAKLLAEVEAQDLDFGIMVDEIDGGFTFTSSSRTNSFSILTRTARRVYLDGRPDELVRGIDMVGTPLAAFSELIAAGDQPRVFNGRCGAESGWIPVSAVSPDLLFRHLEFQRKKKSVQPPPLLDKPMQMPVTDGLAPEQFELQRTLQQSGLLDAPPIYFARTQLYSGQVVYAMSEFGSLKRSTNEPYSRLGIELRLGSPEFDNTRGYRRVGFASVTLPLVPTPWTTRMAAWIKSDEAYVKAVEAYAHRSARADREDQAPPSYSLMAPVQHLLPVPSLTLPLHLDELSKDLSKPFITSPPFYFAEAHTSAGQGSLWIRDSAGTQVRRPATRGLVRVLAGLHAKDGMLIADQRLWLERDPSQLPSTEEMKAEVVAMRDQLLTVAQAPALEKDYLGPVIFEASAATDLFRYLLLSQLEGTPTLDPNQEQDQARRGMVATQPKVGRRVLPRGWTVVDDPRSREDRPGYSLVDNEGTPTQRLVMVDDGLVRTLYMSRTPRSDLDTSNGHARGRLATISHGRAYQVEVLADRQLSTRRLLRAGLREARKTGLDHVLIIRRLQDPSVRRVHSEAGIPLPLAIIKHYADGREELYRGASFVNIQAWLLRDILAAGPMIDQSFLAAWVPDSLHVGDYTGLETTISAPSVLVGEVEITPFSGDPDNLYLLPPPETTRTP